MFYITEVEDHIRLEPKLFGLPTLEAVNQQLKETYVGHYDRELGKVITVIELLEIGEGVIMQIKDIITILLSFFTSKTSLKIRKQGINTLMLGLFTSFRLQS